MFFRYNAIFLSVGLFAFNAVANPFFVSNLKTDDILLEKVIQYEKALVENHILTEQMLQNDGLPPFFHPEASWATAKLWTTGDASPLYRTLQRVQHPQNHSKGLDAHLPLASYTFDWPRLLNRYLVVTDEVKRAHAFSSAYLPHWIEYFTGLEDADGLLDFSRMPDAWRGSLPTDWSEEVYSLYLNLEYYASLIAVNKLQAGFPVGIPTVEVKLNKLRNSIWSSINTSQIFIWNDDAVNTKALIPSLSEALVLNLIDDSFFGPFVQLLRKHGLPEEEWAAPSVLKACVMASEHQLAYDLLTFAEADRKTPVMTIAFHESLLGLDYLDSESSLISISPIHLSTLGDLSATIPVTNGKITYQSRDASEQLITTPTDVGVVVTPNQGVRTMVQTSVSHNPPERLTPLQLETLASSKWADWSDGKAAIWVSVSEQTLRIIQNDGVLYQTKCATSAKGTGSLMNSLKTPLGWHRINKKVGDDAPWGQVFRARQATREVWRPGEDTKEDLVLTRILLLTGEEKGLNKGGNVDSFARNIYLHGTNDEAKIGTPSSHGCIRLRNDDVIEIFDWLDVGMKVLITEE